MTDHEGSEIQRLFKKAFTDHEEREAELLNAHAILDNQRFGEVKAEMGTRSRLFKWLTLANVVVIAGVVSSAYMFLYNLRAELTQERTERVGLTAAVVELKGGVLSGVEQITSLRKEMREDRAAERLAEQADARSDRASASAGRQRDRERTMENNAADRAKAASEAKDARVKAQIDRDRDRDEKANSTRRK